MGKRECQGKQVLTEREERRYRTCLEEREAIEHMWRGCGEMREREGEKRTGRNTDQTKRGWDG
jgi:hypothetical protein